MCAFDVRSADLRAQILDCAFERQLLIAPTGAAGIRFRPALNVGDHEIDEGLNRLHDALRAAPATV